MHLLDPRFALPREEALRFAADRGFGLVVAFDAERPIGSHLPFALRWSGSEAKASLHVARNNPLARLADGRDWLIAVGGVDAYVSNDWYAATDQVSTWLYEAVHLTGAASRLSQADNRAHGNDLVEVCEARLAPKPPWHLDSMHPARRAAMLRDIVVIEIAVASVEGQRKMNQHKPDRDHVAVVHALDHAGDMGSSAVAQRMRRSRPHLYRTHPRVEG